MAVPFSGQADDHAFFFVYMLLRIWITYNYEILSLLKKFQIVKLKPYLLNLILKVA
jgi:hypothetical protein